MRPEGFYWVRIEDYIAASRGELWTVAEWTGCWFRVIGTDEYMEDHDCSEIGSRIEEPAAKPTALDREKDGAK